MSRHDWYRNTTWNKEIEAAFQERYKRSRGEHSKVQYLRIQGLFLVNSQDAAAQRVGVGFLNRVIDEFPSCTNDVNMAKNHLADHYTATEEWEKAAYFLHQILDVKNKSDLPDELDFKFAENLLKRNNKTELEESYSKISKVDVAEFTFNSQRFYTLKILAFVSNTLGKQAEACSYATKALEASQVTQPDFLRHPNIGLVHPSEEEIAELKAILNIQPFSH